MFPVTVRMALPAANIKPKLVPRRTPNEGQPNESRTQKPMTSPKVQAAKQQRQFRFQLVLKTRLERYFFADGERESGKAENR